MSARRLDASALRDWAHKAVGGTHDLNVRIPPAAGPAMGVRHRLAEAGALSADIADGSHVELLDQYLGGPTTASG